MLDQNKLKQIIREKIGKLRNLGEHSGGSGHLAYRSITKFNLREPKEIVYNDIDALEIICEYEIYTETEFLHPPEADEYFTEHYRDKIIISKDYDILRYDFLD